jgi:hypothetical protein
VVFQNAILSQQPVKKKKKEFTADMRNELTQMISVFAQDETFMGKVIDIVVKGMPHLQNLKSEMELDLNLVPSPVLWKLWGYCKKVIGKNGILPVEIERDETSDDSD